MKILTIRKVEKYSGMILDIFFFILARSGIIDLLDTRVEPKHEFEIWEPL